MHSDKKSFRTMCLATGLKRLQQMGNLPKCADTTVKRNFLSVTNDVFQIDISFYPIWSPGGELSH